LASAHVHIEDGFGPEERQHQLKRRVWFRRLALSGAHTSIVLPSQNLVRIATEQWRLGGHVRYIANGIDCDRFRTERDREGEPLTVGTVATLRPEKNLIRLIASFAEAQRQRPGMAWRLLIVGDGPERAKLEQAAARTDNPDSILFPGASETPEQFLAQMDIFAMSSDTEQMPLGVLEAMAGSLPVVSTKVGDVAAMLAAENGPYVTGLDDAQGLTRSLVTLADDAGTRMRIGEANRAKVVADYDYRVMAQRYAELFD
jgi:glycosyltransferase involved in cell wall biosynthesis